MLRPLKKIVPLAARTKIKWAGYAVKDIFDRPQGPRIPPRRNTFIGGGDFASVGEDFFKTLKRYGLTADMDVLDVGCGQGRMARPMTGFFSTGSYTGFDIVRSGIEWCQKEYAAIEKFKFIHADIFNKRYNKTGQVSAKNYHFPFDDNRFDRVFLTSVFTHMLAEDVENYLSEISRVLRPDGQALTTWFLLDEISRHSTHPVLNFAYEIDAMSRTTVKSNPEAAIAFDIEYIRMLFDKTDLTIENIDWGTWSRPESAYSLQDLIVAVKSSAK